MSLAEKDFLCGFSAKILLFSKLIILVLPVQRFAVPFNATVGTIVQRQTGSSALGEWMGNHLNRGNQFGRFNLIIDFY
jgi:hypothetical protein